MSVMPSFAEYLEKWLKQSTSQGLTNPLVKMPVKRFRFLQPDEFGSLANGGSLIIGTMSDPVARNLHKNYQTRIRERGELGLPVDSPRALADGTMARFVDWHVKNV